MGVRAGFYIDHFLLTSNKNAEEIERITAANIVSFIFIFFFGDKEDELKSRTILYSKFTMGEAPSTSFFNYA
jgi:hypothetical protein